MRAFLLFLLALLVVATAYSNNCNGSSRCNKGMHSMCRNAYARYTDNRRYNGYTSRTYDHCTAIFRCSGGYPSMTGRELKNIFDQIYGGQGCRGCGSHAFNGNCEVTVNYCDNCRDSGDSH